MEVQTKTKPNTKLISGVGALAALAFALQMLGTLIGLRVGGFLDVEISDLPAMLAALAFGPAAGVLVELIKNLLHCTVTSTGFVGEFANFIINGLFVLTIGLLYKREKTKKGALKALAIGVVVLAVAGALANLFIMLPLYMADAPFNAKINLVLTLITPFNLCRGAVLSVLISIIYKRFSQILH